MSVCGRCLTFNVATDNGLCVECSRHDRDMARKAMNRLPDLMAVVDAFLEAAAADDPGRLAEAVEALREERSYWWVPGQEWIPKERPAKERDQ